MPPVARGCPKCGTLLSIPQPAPAKVMCPKCGAHIKLKGAPAEAAVAPMRSEPPAARGATATFVPTGIPKAPPGHVLVREIARGGLGVVYLARHALLDDVRAVKRPLPSGEIDWNQLLARFRREVQAVGAIRHDCVVRAYDAGSDEFGPYLITEYLDGEPLSRIVARHKPLALAQACELIRQTALGLQAAHERGIIHRDVKPSNLMLARANTGMARVVVIDWGLARWTASAPTPAAAGEGLTSIGSTMGTLDYAAPEQIANAAQADARSDIYGLGATFFFLLAARTPFQGRADADKLAAQLREPFPPLASFRPDVPPEVSAILARMADKDPARRYRSMAEVAAALQPYCCGPSSPLLPALLAPTPEGFAPAPDTADLYGKKTELAPAPRSGTPQSASAPRGRRALWIGSFAVLLLSGAAIAWTLLRNRSDGEQGAENKHGGAANSLLLAAPKGPVLPGSGTGVIAKIEKASSVYQSGVVLQFTTLQFMPDGLRAIGHEDTIYRAASYGRLVYLDLAEKTLRPAPLPLGLGMLSADPRGKRIACSEHKTIHLFEGSTFKKEGVVGLGEVCTALALSPDGQLLVTAELAGKKGRVRFTDVDRRLPIARSDMEFDAPVVSLAFSFDGTRFASTNGNFNGYHISDAEDKRIRIWNAKDSSLILELAGHPKAVCAAAFFADGRRLFSASPVDATLRVWNVDEADKPNAGKEAKPPIVAGEKWPNPQPSEDQHNPRHVTAVAFWPFGRAVTGYRFGGITLWDLETGKAIIEYPSPSDQAHAHVVSAAISPDGHHALSALSDGNVYLYRLPPPMKRP